MTKKATHCVAPCFYLLILLFRAQSGKFARQADLGEPPNPDRLVDEEFEELEEAGDRQPLFRSVVQVRAFWTEPLAEDPIGPGLVEHHQRQEDQHNDRHQA